MNPDDAEQMLHALSTGLDTPGPALKISDRETSRLVGSVLRERAAPPLARKPPRWGRRAAAAVPALLVVAAAAYWISQGAVERAPEPRVRLAPAPSAVASVAPARTRVPELGTPATNEEPGAALAPTPKARPLHTPAAPDAAAPEDLLQRANRLRRKGEWKEAEATYLQITRLQPGTLSAYVALASVGSLRLGRDPRSALALYERARAQNPGGPLDADIRWGIASAHRALGNTQAEQSALEALLRLHPGAPTTDRARTRLRALAR